MHTMSEFRAHYVCTNLNNVRENIVREVMKPGNPDLANLAFQWITLHYNGKKTTATQQTTVIIEGRKGLWVVLTTQSIQKSVDGCSMQNPFGSQYHINRG